MNPPGAESTLPDIQDILPPEEITSIWPMIGWIAAGVLVVALLAGLLIYFTILDKRKTAVKPSPQALARQKLAEIARRADEMTPNEFSLSISETLKDYLSSRFEDPIRYETSEEFLSRIAGTSADSLPDSKKQTVAEFVSICDEIKFGRPPDAEKKKPKLLEQARAVVEDPISLQPTGT